MQRSLDHCCYWVFEWKEGDNEQVAVQNDRGMLELRQDNNRPEDTHIHHSPKGWDG